MHSEIIDKITKEQKNFKKELADLKRQVHALKSSLRANIKKSYFPNKSDSLTRKLKSFGRSSSQLHKIFLESMRYK